MRIDVTPTEVVTGPGRVGVMQSASYSLRQVDEPVFEDVPYVVVTDRRGLITYLESTNDVLVNVARIAAQQSHLARAKGLKMARENPEMHPLFQKLEKVENLVVLRMSADPAGWVEFDGRTRLETHPGVQIVHSLRGDLPLGVRKRLAFSEGAMGMVIENVLIGEIETRDRQLVVVNAFRADEEHLRVAAAAGRTKPDAALKSARAAVEAHQKQKGGAALKAALGELLDRAFGGGSGQSEGFDPEADETEGFAPEGFGVEDDETGE